MQCGVGSCVTEFPILFRLHVLFSTRCQGCKLAIHIKLDYPSPSYSILYYIISSADMATMVHSDICSLLNGETFGKTKKTRKTKGSYPAPSKTLENNQKNQKNQRSGQPWETSGFGHALSPIIAEIVDFGHQLNILLPEYWISAIIREYGVQTSPKVAEIFGFFCFFGYSQWFCYGSGWGIWFLWFFWFFLWFEFWGSSICQNAPL